jgi:two-component system nitrogen regulation sensor histidine kinase NtrY
LTKTRNKEPVFDSRPSSFLSGKGRFLSATVGNIYGHYKRPPALRLSGRGWRGSWSNRIALLLMIAAIGCGIATYGALTETPPFGNDPSTVIWLLNLDMIILLFLVTLIARRVVAVWSGRKRGVAGSRLHVRLVVAFSLLAAVPAVIMTVFAAFFLHFGVQSWFGERVSTAVREAQAVAEAYLEEHQQVIRADILAMANDLNRQSDLYVTNPELFDRLMQTQSLLRNLSEAIVFDSQGKVMAHAGLTFTLALDSLPAYTIEQADNGDVVLMTGAEDDRVRALVKLNNFNDAYLFVGRMVDQTVLSHLDDTKQAVAQYEALEDQRSDLQVKITMIFVAVALLLLVIAIWSGLFFARQLVMPISSLIAAADRVRAGDLTARVPEFNRRDEFDLLGRTFNRMTSQLQEQRDELVTANRQLDQRRRFTETVLAGVSSGIVGVDERGIISLANSSAAELFGTEAAGLTGRNIADIVPELGPLLVQAHQKPAKITQSEIPFSAPDEARRTFLVRIAIEMIGGEDKGAVLTFDDITELQSAQRKAAWADVARRIAHEIKNPLTPIQLSAERLKRKYLKQIQEDPDTFSKCTDTIIHHVGDIGRMVNEFSAFARMPEPVMRHDNLSAHIRDMIVMRQQAHPHIRFNLIGADKPVPGLFDGQQIRQAFTNILQNAIDSVEGRPEGAAPGQLDIMLATRRTDEDDDVIVLSVTDNGLGLPQGEDLARLTEPYVTHREKGTGLGLAIVKKIMEDHGGRVVLGTPDWLRALPGWHDLGGATVSLVMPLDAADTAVASTPDAA